MQRAAEILVVAISFLFWSAVAGAPVMLIALLLERG
jgi:hypothetical protein